MSEDTHDDPSRLDTLTEELEATRRALLEAQAEIAGAERRRHIDQALIDAHAIDHDTLRLLVEMELDTPGDDARADPAHIVAQLRESKPWLFATPAAPVTSTGVAHHQPAPRNDLTVAEVEARQGSRGALLRYLRLKREGASR